MLAETFRIGFSLGIVLYLIAYEDVKLDVYKSITIDMTIGFVLTNDCKEKSPYFSEGMNRYFILGLPAVLFVVR